MVEPILLFFVPICGFSAAKRTAKIGTEGELPSGQIKKRQACTPMPSRAHRESYQMTDNQLISGRKNSGAETAEIRPFSAPLIDTLNP
jgi:hypothetical protein